MGSIKNTTQDSHILSEDEMNYLINLNAAKQNIVKEYDRVMSAFLHYLASSKFGFKPGDDLQFEIDFADLSRNLKITKL